jgi:hypothetical protein
VKAEAYPDWHCMSIAPQSTDQKPLFPTIGDLLTQMPEFHR